jgi:hypothetical protein
MAQILTFCLPKHCGLNGAIIRLTFGLKPVTLYRISTIIIVMAMTTLPGAQKSFAQDLSDASLAVGTNWARGYMGLGGNLGKAIVKHPSARTAKAANAQRRPTTRRNRPVTAARRDTYYDTPVFLISQSLDHTGLNVGALRTSTPGP